MTDALALTPDAPVTTLRLVRPDTLGEALAACPPAVARLASAAGFKAKSGQALFAPADGEDLALAGLGDGPVDPSLFRAVAARLPAGLYRIAGAPDDLDLDAASLAWLLGLYRYPGFKRREDEPGARLLAEGLRDPDRVRRTAAACALARDLVNTPANHMGPAELEAAARRVAEAHGAEVSVTSGADLLAAGYPAVHAVGRAADPARAPRMVELTWGREGAPRVALVGKGVVFDTGGLDLKPSAAMRLMKKDMGGAAHALALADMLMGDGAPIRLHLLLPIVENAVSGDAMRPGDVLATRKGLSVEVGNTDAEGRLILADALARAGEFAPEITLDFATLTGAARIALGPQVTPFFTDDEALAQALVTASAETGDPLWRLPLWSGYEEAIDSDVADVKNDADAWAQAGSVTAALFLRRFAPAGAWAHFDLFAWNARARPGWPAGGEAQVIRAARRALGARLGFD